MLWWFFTEIGSVILIITAFAVLVYTVRNRKKLSPR